MKQLLLLLLVLLIGIPCFSQEETEELKPFIYTTYKSKKGVTVYDKSEAYAIETVGKRNCKNNGSFKLTRISDGLELITGQYYEGKRVGIWTHYYDNGKLKEKRIPPSDSQFKRAEVYNYYSNGQLYQKSVSNLIQEGYLPDGTPIVVNGKGNMKYYDEEGKQLQREVEIELGKRNGKQIVYRTNGSTVISHFENGRKISSTNTMEVEEKNAQEEQVQKVSSDVPPQYPGGQNQLRFDVSRKFKITNEFKENKQLDCATVIMRFTVLEDGSIGDIEALTNYGFGLEEEGKRSIQSLSKKFTPGTQDGKPVKVKYTLPIVVRGT